ncbi:hypothetical protein FOL46_009695 [Perkinsus olseni]|uniref:Protein kinase domain-containing protein n=1 Tax=Perkinsus olseni TaxID=32597 RepID=A0A7J6L021_PEROL|nr:hypothetical protein FOL46_009695 [Perkinsus olseni]
MGRAVRHCFEKGESLTVAVEVGGLVRVFTPGVTGPPNSGLSWLKFKAVLGSGAYGTVVAAEKVTPESSKSDKKNEEDVSAVVAVKKFSNPLSHVVYAKRTLREIRFLRHLRHENIIELESIYVSGESSAGTCP